jgi:CBS-domain-containing membrane protein
MRRQTVKDVMTRDVVSVAETTQYKDIVQILAERTVSAVPVVDDAGKVIGIVSEADLLHKMQYSGLEPHVHLLERKQRRVARAKADSEEARDLMTSPALTVDSDTPLPSVAKTMDDERVKRLPVVDEQGRLVGIVSRRDLLRVYLRDDATIRDDIREQVLRRTLWMDPDMVTVTVDHGVVTLAGTADRRSTAQITVRLCEGVDGVVDVVDQLGYEYDDTADLNRRHLMGPTVKETIP